MEPIEKPSEPDDRLPALRSAVEQLRQGNFGVAIPTEPLDAVGAIGLELTKLAESLEQHYDETRKFQYIAEQVTSGLFLDEVLDKVFETFRAVIPYNRLGAAFLSDDKLHLTHYWGRSDAAKILIQPGFTASMVGSSLQTVIETGRPRILNDLETYLTEHPKSHSTRLMVDEGVRSSLTCPLIAHGKSIGFLFFSSFAMNTYEHVHQGAYLRLAVQLSLLVEKSRLYQDLYEINQELQEAKRVLYDQAIHDELTGLYNRRAIMDLLNSRLSRATREGFPISLVMIDIDYFKKINDDYGHPFGDLALKAVAERLNRCVRDYNRIGRYGGEEFLIVLDRDDAEAAEHIAERLRMSVADETLIECGHQVHLTVSIGVAIATTAIDLDPHQFISVADQALYNAKQNGRNQVVVRYAG
ncbi:MAG: GGDEF domain-containing protein [Rhodocyclaceae bacterium]|nr:MAG: GGDEF domain-containing protein [Rhodocyclaceae bacterium]